MLNKLVKSKFSKKEIPEFQSRSDSKSSMRVATPLGGENLPKSTFEETPQVVQAEKLENLENNLRLMTKESDSNITVDVLLSEGLMTPQITLDNQFFSFNTQGKRDE